MDDLSICPYVRTDCTYVGLSTPLWKIVVTDAQTDRSSTGKFDDYRQGCRGYGYPWIYPWICPCVDIRLRQYPWIFMDTYGYFYVTALKLAKSQNHNKTKQNRLFVGQLVLVLNLSNTRNVLL